MPAEQQAFLSLSLYYLFWLIDMYSTKGLNQSPSSHVLEEEESGVRSGQGAARTILLFHIISARPFKQPLMVRNFLKVYMELGEPQVCQC